MHPQLNGAYNPTGFYRSRDDRFYIAFGFLDGFNSITGVHDDVMFTGTDSPFNTAVYSLENSEMGSQNFSEVFVSGPVPQGRGFSIGVSWVVAR